MLITATRFFGHRPNFFLTLWRPLHFGDFRKKNA